MKKVLSIFLVAILVISTFTGCSLQSATASDDDKIQIVATSFAEYDWLKEITAGSDAFTLTLLIDNGVDIHSYQPSVGDIVAISSCDMFVYTSGTSDTWVQEALSQSINPDMVVIDLIQVLGDGVREEEIVEGMEHDHDHDDEDDHDHDEECTDEDCDHDHEDEEEHVHTEDCDHDHEEDDHDHEEECTDEDCDHDHEYDEHVWLSLQNAQLYVNYLTTEVCALDSENASLYTQNANSYIAKLSALDSEYATAVATALRDTILVADRFPFAYLVSDYNINYYAAFSGCSAETEASFETIVFLAGKVDELNLETVLIIDGTTHKIAETVVNSSQAGNATILTLNSMQSTTSSDIESGATYLSIMEENLEVLKIALN